MKTYEEFLCSKRITAPPSGIDVHNTDISPLLFPFQRDIVEWALRRGRSAIFADCGLGKTPMQLQWAEHVASIGKPVLILAPLAVTRQTQREGEKFGVPVTVCRSQSDVTEGVNITNYEMLSHFEASAFGGLVLDESSILKSYDGPTRREITDFGRAIPYRLACTATPAPNDIAEIINHAEFLSIMGGKEIMALFFTQDGNTTHRWRLKGHAKEDFWRWMASWSVALRRPSDLGYSDEGFVLPELRTHQVSVDAPEESSFSLVTVEALTMDERRAARRDSLPARVQMAADVINASDDTWLVWCNLNAEGDALENAIDGAVQITGADPPEVKEKALLGFLDGTTRVLVTKPTIAGHGLNLQHCNKMAFVGLSDSWEQYYQAVRRCWRFGQTKPVDCFVITAETEGAVVKNIERKERQAAEMMENLVSHMAGLSLNRAEREEMEYSETVRHGKNWTLYQGDCVEMTKHVESDTIGLTVFSPPFPGMYAYTNSARDMGNVKSIDEMIEQYKFLIPELLRVTIPGRSCCVHLTQAVAFKGVDGYIGLKDFRGRVISAMEDAGWIYYGEVCIDKDPQVKAIRTKDRGLLFKSLANDSANMHMALADYLLQFRKPGDNPMPIRAGVSKKYQNEEGWITSDEWIEWAAPVWYRQTEHYPGGIRETDVLNVAQARETDDERHLCPLQLGVIERAVKLWSAPTETVFSPFAGIGSEGYVSILNNRKFIGVELKGSYFQSAIRNLTNADAATKPLGLFDFVDGEEDTDNDL